MRPIVVACLLLLTVPAAADAAQWPTMRHDQRNTGRAEFPNRYRGDKPWQFKTGKGIFSTPVIGDDGTAYVGSADTFFYALDRRGRARWKFRTGGIIDAAAALQGRTVTFGSGDEKLYRLQLRGRRRPAVDWAFKAKRPPSTGQLVNWWEGNVAIGPDLNVYAGNTGGGAYSVTGDGEQRWVYQAGNSVWTTPAFGPDGSTYWGSLDLSLFALDANGNKRWSTSTLGYNVSSPALSRDGSTLYVGSFDNKLYALDTANGAPRWTFQTRDHVYSSPALAEDASGAVTAIYIASTDGSVYAVGPDGQQLWRYDTGDPVRGSPVLADGIVYVGSADGRLYALDAATGRRRWSYDTTPGDPSLRDRNDLNGSPALGRTGIYVGGEHGYVTYVPYDWCLQKARLPRCDTSAEQPFGGDLTRVFPVSAGGGTLADGYPGRLAASSVVNARLVVRRGGQTVDASAQPVPSPEGLVTADPPFPFSLQLSGDGRHLFVRPDGFLAPDTLYRLRFNGPYTADGARPAGAQIGATGAGVFDDTLTFRTAPLGSDRLPLSASTRRGAVSAMRVRRLAVPLPPFLTSVNQIGFDSYDLIAGTLAKTPPGPDGEGSVLLWVIAGKRGPRGIEVADPKGGFGFPIAGRYRGDALILSREQLSLTFSFGEVPTRRFELRGQLGRDLRMKPGANIFAEVTCTDVPNYGPVLVAIGLCNARNTLTASGTFLTERYDRRGPANRRPRGLRVTGVRLEGDSVVADFALRGRGVRYRAADHVASVVLVDADSGRPVPIDYVKGTSVEADSAGNLRSARVTIPPGTQLPARLRAYVVADVYPLAVRDLAR